MDGRTIPLLLACATMVLAGCATSTSQGDDVASAGGAPWQRLHVFDGEVRDPTQVLAFPFDVPGGAQEVEALLTWSSTGALLGFRLLDANGTEAARGWNEGDGRAYVTTTHPVAGGGWMLEVSAERAAATRFAATVTVHGAAVPEGPIQASMLVEARNPTRDLPPEVRGELPALLPRDYAEVNLNMAPGDGFRFSWNATGPVYFNVHFHGADGTTQRPIEERSAASSGEFTANATEVYALLWRNEGSSDVTVSFELDGTYRLHSMTRRS